MNQFPVSPAYAAHNHPITASTNENFTTYRHALVNKRIIRTNAKDHNPIDHQLNRCAIGKTCVLFIYSPIHL